MSKPSTDRPLRVIQWTTGNIGRRSLHAIIGRPDLEADEQQARLRASALYHSLHTLLALPSDTLVLPGEFALTVPALETLAIDGLVDV